MLARADHSPTAGAIFFFASIAALLVCVTALATYHSILGYYFTATDTLTLIDTSHITVANPAWRQLTQPLMANSHFIGHALFYRPVAGLSFALDYSLWGLDPSGYQLTNLLIQALVCLCVFFLVFLLADWDVLPAFLSAMVFALHPILVECVPAIARRQDMLATLFLLLSLLCFVHSLSGQRFSRLLLFCSLACFLAAFGSKETGILVLPLVYSWAFLSSITADEKSPRLAASMTFAMRKSMPFLTIALVFLVWRAVVIHAGMGGYSHMAGQEIGITKISHFLVSTISRFFIDLLFPAGPANDLLVSFSTGVVLVLMVGGLLLIGYGVRRLKQPPMQFFIRYCKSATGRLVTICAVWLVSCLALFVVTHTFDHRSMYLATVPFSILLAFALVISVNTFRSRKSAITLLPVFITSALVLELTWYSPVRNVYGEWRDSGEISRMVLPKLGDLAQQLPPDTVLHIIDMPWGIDAYKNRTPRAKSVTYLADHSVRSWLDLTVPANRIDVVVDSYAALPTLPKDIGLATEKFGAGEIYVRIVPSF